MTLKIPLKVIEDLYHAGAPDRAIARRLGISPLWISLWRRRHRLPPTEVAARFIAKPPPGHSGTRWEKDNQELVARILAKAGIDPKQLEDRYIIKVIEGIE